VNIIIEQDPAATRVDSIRELDTCSAGRLLSTDISETLNDCWMMVEALGLILL
jgi:hypothetical protein